MIDMQSEVILEVKDLSKLFLDPSESLALGWQNPLSGRLLVSHCLRTQNLVRKSFGHLEMFSLL